MRRGTLSSGGGGAALGLPPFRGAVRWLVITNIAIYFGLLLLNGLFPDLARLVRGIFSLTPSFVLHGVPLGFLQHVPAVWQLVTYGFLHAGVLHVLFNMLGLWIFGATFDLSWGSRRFMEYFLWCVIGAAITTIGIAYIGLWLTHASPNTPLFAFLATAVEIPVVGASGGLYGILIAFAIFYGDTEFFLFPLPFQIKAKYLIAGYMLIALAGALGEGGGQAVANVAHLGGALFGWIYLKTVPRGGLQVAFSESYYGARNRYYKWKRRQAAKKFEVYMRQHKREDFFDEYGNYKGPGAQDHDKGNGESRGPWVN